MLSISLPLVLLHCFLADVSQEFPLYIIFRCVHRLPFSFQGLYEFILGKFFAMVSDHFSYKTLWLLLFSHSINLGISQQYFLGTNRYSFYLLVFQSFVFLWGNLSSYPLQVKEDLLSCSCSLVMVVSTFTTFCRTWSHSSPLITCFHWMHFLL